MSEDLYVYFTDLKYTRTFKDCSEFVYPFEYDPVSRVKMHREEYGKLKLSGGDNLHLLLDLGLDPRCPWCGRDEPKICIGDSEFSDRKVVFAKCLNCEATGPKTQVLALHLKDDIMLESTKEFVIHKWKERIKKCTHIPQERDE